jgi:hypothetical protein
MNTLLTALAGGRLTMLGAVTTGWLTNRLGAERDKRRYEHEREMAREALGQERLDRTYTELGIYLSHYADWARSVHPFIGTVPAPDPLAPGERWRIETLVTNHGSPDADDLGNSPVSIAEIPHLIERSASRLVLRLAAGRRDDHLLDEVRDGDGFVAVRAWSAGADAAAEFAAVRAVLLAEESLPQGLGIVAGCPVDGLMAVPACQGTVQARLPRSCGCRVQ